MTPTQRKNLLKLAAGLEALPDNYKEFHMENFAVEEDGLVPPQRAVCGTVACAAGHGPRFGIKPKRRERWFEYVDRCFVEESTAFDWMFGAFWAWSEWPTAKDAAKRIRWYVENESRFISTHRGYDNLFQMAEALNEGKL